jgi:hypothetical protein
MIIRYVSVLAVFVLMPLQIQRVEGNEDTFDSVLKRATEKAENKFVRRNS